MSETILRVEDLQKYYGNRGSVTRALDHIGFCVEKGEFLGIMGASGSGKTTLLNCISTLDTVTSGRIYVEGEDITALRGAALCAFRGQKLGFIFQDFNLLDTLTAWENIALPLSIAGFSPAPDSAARPSGGRCARHRGEPAKISLSALRRPAAARGRCPCRGHQSGASSGRMSPRGALDSGSSRRLLALLSQINRDLCATILMVTHDAFSASYCSRILFIKDGRIFHELNRGPENRRAFFAQILDVVSVMGGDGDERL